MKKLFIRGVILTTAALLLTGCSTLLHTKKNPYENQSPAAIYKNGLAYLKKGNYTNAITAFQALDSQYPFNSYTQKGDLGLIYANFQQGNPALALATAKRFINMYPTNPDAAYAYYMTGVIDFNNGRGFLQRRFPYTMSQHDITNYIAAYKNFQLLINQYPKSQYAQDAQRRMIFLDQVMAQHQLNIAAFYLKQGALAAAANRATNVFLHYPRTPQVEPALLIMLRAYHDLGLPELTQKTAQIIQLNYPNNRTYQSLMQDWNLKVS